MGKGCAFCYTCSNMATLRILIDGKWVDHTPDKTKSTLRSALAPLSALAAQLAGVTAMSEDKAKLAWLESPSLWIPVVPQLAEQLVAPLSTALLAMMPPNSPITRFFEEEKRKYLALCADLGINPYEPHLNLYDFSQEEIERRAAVAREGRREKEQIEQILQRIGDGTATNDEIEYLQRPRRLKPARKPRPDKQYAVYAQNMIDEWRRWKRGGHSQQEFAEYKGWESRTPLTDAISWYREQFGNDSI
jgi:hypothetical protein